MNPFEYSNINRLIEYLEQQSGDDNSMYTVNLTTSFTEYINGFKSFGQSTFKMRVEGIRAIRALFQQYRDIDIITWKNHNMKVILNCKERSLHIVTDSINFIQICRHTMTGQNVSKITVDLNPL